HTRRSSSLPAHRAHLLWAHPEAYTSRSTRSVPSSTCPQSVRMPQSRIQVWKWKGWIRLVFQRGYDEIGGLETWRRSALRVNPRQMRWLRAWGGLICRKARWWVELRRPGPCTRGSGCQSRKGALLQELEDSGPLPAERRPCSFLGAL
ncbi:hypothetical protein BC826DRAFT_1016089, partial [Russula brevipes]